MNIIRRALTPYRAGPKRGNMEDLAAFSVRSLMLESAAMRTTRPTNDALGAAGCHLAEGKRKQVSEVLATLGHCKRMVLLSLQAGKHA